VGRSPRRPRVKANFMVEGAGGGLGGERSGWVGGRGKGRGGERANGAPPRVYYPDIQMKQKHPDTTVARRDTAGFARLKRERQGQGEGRLRNMAVCVNVVRAGHFTFIIVHEACSKLLGFVIVERIKGVAAGERLEGLKR